MRTFGIEPQSIGSRIRHAAGRLRIALVAGTLAAGAVLPMAASPTLASVSATDGRSGSTTVACSQSYRQMTAVYTVLAARRFARQTVSVRTYIQPLNGAAGFWTSPMTFIAPSALTYTVNFAGLAVHDFRVYVEYGWFDGSTWSHGGEWITTYVQSTWGSRFTMTYCTV